MERLTVNKPVSEMNMVELAHNCCYFSEDGNARYRDYERDIDAREFTRRLMRIYEGEDLSEGDTEFDEEVMTELKYDPEIYSSALIALFYRNMWAMAELRSRLKYYEDAEEQGLLLRLPCKVGNNYWIFNTDCLNWNEYKIEYVECVDYRIDFYKPYLEFHPIDNPFASIVIFKDKNDKRYSYCFKDIPTHVFLTKEEAEKKLAEMKEGAV